MGGRGVSSGVSVKGKPYGSEFRTLLQADNVKFVKQNAAMNANVSCGIFTFWRGYAQL